MPLSCTFNKMLSPGSSTRSTPRVALSLGVLNVCSACRTAALIHDVIGNNQFDVLTLTETWIPSDASDAVKLYVCPPGYQVLSEARQLTSAAEAWHSCSGTSSS